VDGTAGITVIVATIPSVERRGHDSMLRHPSHGEELERTTCDDLRGSRVGPDSLTERDDRHRELRSRSRYLRISFLSLLLWRAGPSMARLDEILKKPHMTGSEASSGQRAYPCSGWT